MITFQVTDWRMRPVSISVLLLPLRATVAGALGGLGEKLPSAIVSWMMPAPWAPSRSASCAGEEADLHALHARVADGVLQLAHHVIAALELEPHPDALPRH